MSFSFFKKINIPYPYLFSTKRNIIISTSIGIVIFGINFLLISNQEVRQTFILPKIQICLTAASLTFLSILFMTELIPKVFFSNEIKESWNVTKEFIFTLTILTTIALFQNSIIFFLKKDTTNFILSFLNTFVYAVFIGVIPVSLVIWANYVVILKKNLKNVTIYNLKLEEELKLNQSAFKNSTVCIKTDNISETLILDITNFLFAKSEGNYVDIYQKDNDFINIKPYRLSIQKLIIALKEYPCIMSPHRSYIINISNIKRTSGNARNYKVFFNYTSHEVPVSRNKFQLFKKAFDDHYHNNLLSN